VLYFNFVQNVFVGELPYVQVVVTVVLSEVEVVHTGSNVAVTDAGVAMGAIVEFARQGCGMYVSHLGDNSSRLALT
jgi:hypothetical protein